FLKPFAACPTKVSDYWDYVLRWLRCKNTKQIIITEIRQFPSVARLKRRPGAVRCEARRALKIQNGSGLNRSSRIAGAQKIGHCNVWASPPRLVAAVRPTAGLNARRLYCADECAQELLVHLRSETIDVDSRSRQKLSGILDLINASWLDLDLLKSGRLQLRPIFGF